MLIKQLLKLLFILIQLFYTESFAMQIEEPEYYIKLDMHACPRTVIVNGVIIEDSPEGFSSGAEYPINHWVRNGDNTLELFFFSDEDMSEDLNDSSKCNVAVWVKGIVKGQTVNHKVADIIYNPAIAIPKNKRYSNSLIAGKYQMNKDKPIRNENAVHFELGDINIGDDYFNDGGTRFYRNFTVTVPFSEWSFFKGEVIFKYPMNDNKYDTMEAEMWPMLKKLWDMFENKEIDKILPLFELRSKELDQAYYREAGYSIKSFENDLRNVYKAGYPLLRKEIKKMQLVVSYNEKLVTIVNAGSGNGSIIFYDKSSDSVTFFDVVWMKKNGKWIIIR